MSRNCTNTCVKKHLQTSRAHTKAAAQPKVCIRSLTSSIRIGSRRGQRLPHNRFHNMITNSTITRGQTPEEDNGSHTSDPTNSQIHHQHEMFCHTIQKDPRGCPNRKSLTEIAESSKKKIIGHDHHSWRRRTIGHDLVSFV